jgi:gliding motility-associated-like protein
MKKLIFFSVVFIFGNINLFAQNATSCSIADPFCTGVTYGFPMNTNTSAESGPNYSCLYTEPNPVWYYLRILDPGNITINITSPSGNDVDFTCWGPFNDPNTPCDAQLTAACTSCPNNTSDPSFYPSGNTVDCSYDPAPTENCHISNAVTGQYYLLCITNYSNSSGNITFTQSNTGDPGHGTTDCSIITPCDITAVTANPSACDPSTNTYSVSGTITFHDAPTTGQLVVTDGTHTQTFNAPFTSPINYSLSNISSDGVQHTITVNFTGDQFCTFTVNYTAPGPCNQCTTDAGPDFSACGLTANLAAVVQTGDHNTSWSCGTAGVTFTPVGSPTASVTVPSSGTYTFTWTITNSLGTQCSDNVDVIFTQTPTSSFTATPIHCFGQASTITFTGSATGTAVYNWNFGAGSTIVSGSGAGPYQVTWANPGTITISLQVVDNHCLSNTYILTLNQPSALNASVSVTPVSCTNGTNGTVNVSVSGGTPGYAYQWSSGNGSSFPAGNYSVTITDVNNCSLTYPFTVTEPNPIVVIPNQTNLTCYQNNSGMATVSVTGGTGTYSYTWTGNVSNSNTANNLAAGPYSVSIEDGNGCLVTNSFTLSEPPAVSIQTLSTINPSCNGQCNGSISIAGTGGTSPYTYSWSNSATTANITSLCAGAYLVTVYDANSCSATNNYTLTESAALVATITSTTDILCNGQCTGSATVGITNGIPPYSYSWSNNSNNATANNLCVGLYHVSVYDVNGCLDTTSATINEPTALTTLISNVISVNCYGECNGSATVNPNGGTPPYTYNWSSGTPNLPTNNSLCFGTHFVTVTDANGCTSTAVAMVSQPSELVITNISKTNLTCYGSNDGSITVNITGGIGTWTYSIPNQTDTTGHFTNLPAGNYSVTVTDMHGCTTTGSITITQPAISITLIPSHTNVTCYGGSDGTASVTVIGCGSPFTYLWNTSPPQTTDTIINLSAGTYSVTVTNIYNSTATVNVTVTQPDPVVVTAQNYYAVCNGEWVNMTASATGGVPNYTYYWNGNAGSSSFGAQPFINTTYTVSATDSHGCPSNTVTINAAVSPPLSIDVTATPNAICPGQPVQLTPTMNAGGGPPYLIYLEDGTVVTPPITIYPQQSGEYILFAKDVCGSIAQDSVYITVYSLPLVQFVSDTISGCEPLTVSFHPQVSQPGQSYQWNFGDASSNTISFDQNPVHTFNMEGDYSVSLTITSLHGCVNSYTHNDMIHVYPVPDARFIFSPESPSIIKPEVNFTNLSSSFASQFIWSFGDGDSSSIINPYHWYHQVGTYLAELIAITNRGCKDTARSYVIIHDEFTFYAPTYISPDNDDLNDVFYVIGNGITSINFDMSIFDRWGEIIYETNKYDPTNPAKYGWNGIAKNNKMVPIGTYTWLVKYTDPNNVQHEKSGAISVIR